MQVNLLDVVSTNKPVAASILYASADNVEQFNHVLYSASSVMKIS